MRGRHPWWSTVSLLVAAGTAEAQFVPGATGATPTLGAQMPGAPAEVPVVTPFRAVTPVPTAPPVARRTPPTMSATDAQRAAALAVWAGVYYGQLAASASQAPIDPSAYFTNGAEITGAGTAAYFNQGASVTSAPTMNALAPPPVRLEPGQRLSIYDYAGGRAAMPETIQVPLDEGALLTPPPAAP